MATIKEEDGKAAPDKSIEELEKELLGSAPDEGTEKATTAADDATDDDDEGDARLSPDADGQTPDQKEQRRLERQERKARQKMARARTDRELRESRDLIDQLSSRLQHLESGQIGNIASKIKGDMSAANQAYNEAEAALKKAMENNDSEGLVKALRVRDAARDSYFASQSQLGRIEAATKNPPQSQTRQSTEAPDPEMVAEYRKFQARNPWYDPNGRDADSQRAQKIDSSLSEEGFDPTTQDYWEELENRLRRAVPHHYADGGRVKPNGRKGPPVGGAREAASIPSDRDGPSLSRDRLSAIREASGGDPAKYKRLVAYAKKYDKSNTSTTSR